MSQRIRLWTTAAKVEVFVCRFVVARNKVEI